MSDPSSVMIPIKGDATACENDWALLELNGELMLPTELPNDEKSQSTVLYGPNQMELGSLRFQDDKTPIMILGSHELKGSVQHLKQPFCVLEKHEGEGTESPSMEYRIAGVVRTKLLFNNYPKTIMR